MGCIKTTLAKTSLLIFRCVRILISRHWRNRIRIRAKGRVGARFGLNFVMKGLQQRRVAPLLSDGLKIDANHVMTAIKLTSASVCCWGPASVLHSCSLQKTRKKQWVWRLGCQQIVMACNQETRATRGATTPFTSLLAVDVICAEEKSMECKEDQWIYGRQGARPVDDGL